MSVDGFAPISDDGATIVLHNQRFQLTAHRVLKPGAQPSIGLTAIWDGNPQPMVLAEVRER